MGRIRQRIRRWRQARRAKQITLERARLRVARGAAYLDDVDPGWYGRVEAGTLELSSGQACVLGQLHGEYRLGLARAHLVNPSSAPLASLSPADYGFQCLYGIGDGLQDLDYAHLNQAWQEEVLRRQRAGVRREDPEAAGFGGGEAPARFIRERIPLAV